MHLNLEKDLVCFDLEATGLNVIKDRIVQIAMIRISASDGAYRRYKKLINPGSVPISEEARSVHGIGPEDVRDAPEFGEVAAEVHEFLRGADLLGYNSNRFDIPMLMEELARAGYDLELNSRNLIDAQTIFHKMEPRTLFAAYQKFCGEELVGAHDAMADVEATIEVFKAQLSHYKEKNLITEDGVIPSPIRNDMQLLSDFCRNENMLDATRRLKYNDEGQVVFNFGKYVGRPVGSTLYKDKNYLQWIKDKDFSIQVKKLVTQLYEEYAQSVDS